MKHLIDAISIRLDEIFDGKYAIYLETVEQGLNTPCFFIKPVRSEDENMISNRKYQYHDFDIIFIPDDENTCRSLFVEVTDKLFDSFDMLEVNDTTVPTFERTIDVVNNVLHFGVKFKLYGYKDVPEEEMQETMDISVI